MSDSAGGTPPQEPESQQAGDALERGPDELPRLLYEAQRNQALAAALAADLNEVVRRTGLNIDVRSEAYQDLAVRLFHARNVVNTVLDDVVREHFEGLAPEEIEFDIGGLYGGLGDIIIIDPGPIDRDRLRSSIMRELGGGGPKGTPPGG
jgi:hypothetical protein